MLTYHAQTIYTYTPAQAAIDREECDDTHERTWTTEREVFARLCAHWFSAGPQPEEVLQRVFAAAADRRPDLLRGFSKHEVKLAREESAQGRKWRLQALFTGRNEDWRERYRAIIATLSLAHFDAHKPDIARVTLSEALCVAADGSEPPEATETLSRVLDRLFCVGNDPRCVAQQTFALTGWLFRNLQLNMSLDELGRLFSEKRATQSWRSKTYVEAFLRRAGARGCKAGWQKPASASAAYAAAAQGNHNRRPRSRRFLTQPGDPTINAKENDSDQRTSRKTPMP